MSCKVFYCMYRTFATSENCAYCINRLLVIVLIWVLLWMFGKQQINNCYWILLNFFFGSHRLSREPNLFAYINLIQLKWLISLTFFNKRCYYHFEINFRIQKLDQFIDCNWIQIMLNKQNKSFAKILVLIGSLIFFFLILFNL